MTEESILKRISDELFYQFFNFEIHEDEYFLNTSDLLEYKMGLITLKELNDRFIEHDKN